MNMMRTQVLLTERERTGLRTLAEASGKTQSALIREAVDQLIARSDQARRQAAMDRVAGMWKDRRDLPDFRAARRSWDRA